MGSPALTFSLWADFALPGPTLRQAQDTAGLTQQARAEVPPQARRLARDIAPEPVVG